MNRDLKVIKKKYGEEMMHLCRELFPTLLEQEGLLPKLLLDNFKESKSLAKDIIDNNLEEKFKNYIYSQVDVENNYQELVSKRPEELLKEAGYILYECHSEEEIQSFKKYYAKGEELCTFLGGRLNRSFVFFAVKENVDEIKRENFPKPQRQDEYGTSVISIQFTKDISHTLSIKNRYNHRVNNPDSTFGNNLDNIIPGLTSSFDKYYGLHQSYLQGILEIPGYVKASDGKYYKYNYEINNIYYCENNIIIDNFAVKEYPKDQYIILDYFILDLKNKVIQKYWNDMELEDSFPDTIGSIKDIKIEKDGLNKNILIKTDNSDEVDVKIVIDKNNKIVALKNDKVKNINNRFLSHNQVLTSLSLPNVNSVGNWFLGTNKNLIELYAPNLTYVGNYFLPFNIALTILSLPNLKSAEDNFLGTNKNLTELYAPNLTYAGKEFLFKNESLVTLFLQSLNSAGDKFLYFDKSLTTIDLPVLTKAGRYFCFRCNNIQTANIPLMPELEEKLKPNGKHI